MFLPNLDGDFVDVSGRREDGCGGSGRGRRTAAGLLTLGGWGSGCTARARCLFSFFVGRHFLKEGVCRGFGFRTVFLDGKCKQKCNWEHMNTCGVGRIEKKQG